MHPNPIFRRETRDKSLGFALERGFGLLTVNGPERPVVAQVPFVAAEAPGWIEAHLVRSNPLARLLDRPRPALLAVLGPDAYVSPDWYGVEGQVPTWNYVAVHLHGTLSLDPPEAFRGHLDRLSNRFETELAPKPVWRTDKLSQDQLARMMRQIVGVRFEIEAVEGTWKVSQNKPEAARLGAARGVAEAAPASGLGHETARIAALMRDWAGAEPPPAGGERT